MNGIHVRIKGEKLVVWSPELQHLQTVLYETLQGDRGVSQQVKCLLYKYKDWGSGLQHQSKWQRCVLATYHSNTQEVETGDPQSKLAS